MEDHENGVRRAPLPARRRDFTEARRAVRNEKNITEALVYFEKDGLKWKINLKGDIFSFGSFASPPVKIEKDEITDADAEREAVFYERMYLLETGIQLFNSLFAAFLMERIAGKWSEKTALINAWVYQ